MRIIKAFNALMDGEIVARRSWDSDVLYYFSRQTRPIDSLDDESYPRLVDFLHQRLFESEGMLSEVVFTDEVLRLSKWNTLHHYQPSDDDLDATDWYIVELDN